MKFNEFPVEVLRAAVACAVMDAVLAPGFLGRVET